MQITRQERYTVVGFYEPTFLRSFLPIRISPIHSASQPDWQSMQQGLGEETKPHGMFGWEKTRKERESCHGTYMHVVLGEYFNVAVLA